MGRELLVGLFGVFLLSGCGVDPSVSEASSLELTDSICVEFGCDGSAIAGITWNDARGGAVFLVTETRSPYNDDEGEMTQTISAYRYVLLEDGRPQQVWQNTWRAGNPCDEGEGLIGDLVLTDYNGDGVGEVTMVYNIFGNCDVSPKEYGLASHSGVGSGAYEIIGNDDLAINRGGMPGNAEIRLSPSLQSAPDSLQKKLLSIWHDRVPSD